YRQDNLSQLTSPPVNGFILCTSKWVSSKIMLDSDLRHSLYQYTLVQDEIMHASYLGLVMRLSCARGHKMKFTKRHIIALMVVVIIAFTLSMYKLPYYIYKPGGADALDSIVEVEGGHQSAGDMHLVTVSGGQATPV